MSSATAVPLRPVSKGGLAVLWIGLALLIAGAVAWAIFVSNPAQVRIETLEAGSGPSPTDGEFAVIKYEGRIAGGDVFDANDEAPFPVGQTIPGFDQAMRRMQAGGRYRIHIPAELGYGERGAGQVIPPNSDLVFEVELLDIKSAEEMQQEMMMRQMMQQMQQGGEGGPPGGGAPPQGQ
jgi:FKBP-type peptidyl-prolyl cis-trans isomerase FkpA